LISQFNELSTARRPANIQIFSTCDLRLKQAPAARAALLQLARPRIKTLNRSALMAFLRRAGAARAR